MSGHEKPNKGITNEWHTPPYVLEALGPFDDDPCLPGRDDGLTREWNGFVWCNPPYGPEAGAFLEKLDRHAESGGCGIALIFARTETRWFQSEVWEKADALLFLYGRLTFYQDGKPGKGNSGAPSVLVAYGHEAVERLRSCSLSGAFVEGWQSNLKGNSTV